MLPTPRWNEELPLRPQPPLPAPRRYEIVIDKRRPIGVVITNVRAPAGPELRGPTPTLTSIHGVAVPTRKRRHHLAKLRARINALPPGTRAALLARLCAQAQMRGLL